MASKPVPANTKRVVVKGRGKVVGGAGDQRVLLFLNAVETGYNSLNVMVGDFGQIPEHEQRGFYIGRNANGADAFFSFEYTLDVMVGNRRGWGFSTFVCETGGSKLFSGTSSGFTDAQSQPVTSIAIETRPNGTQLDQLDFEIVPG